MPPPPVSEDRLLGGRVRLIQPRAGYRAAIDPVVLAAATNPPVGARVLDAGAGTGAALLCLAARRPDLTLVGLEWQAEAAGWSLESARRNGWADRTRVVCGDLAHPPPELTALGPFAAVMTNPPFVEAHRGTPPPRAARDRAHRERADLPLGGWLAACLALLAPRGWLVVIQRADRLDTLIAGLAGRVGDLTLLPIHPRIDRPASRVILVGRKDARGPARLLPGLVLHPATGSGFTAEAEAILRHAQALDLQPRGRR